MSVTCTPDNLADLAKCFDSISETQLQAIQAYLLCQIANAGGGGGGVTSLVAGENIVITNPAGPAVTVAVLHDPVFGTVTTDGFVIDTSTYSGQTYARITATNAAANVNVVVGWKGSGSFSLQQANGFAGGNQLGSNAVDLSLHDSINPAACASGQGAFNAGYKNVVSGSYSVGIGTSLTSSGGNSVAFGSGSLASGNGAFAFGVGFGGACWATSTSSFSMGYECYSLGAYSFAFGSNVHADSNYSVYLGTGGRAEATTSFGSGTDAYATLYGQRAHAAGSFATRGDSQPSRLHARNATTNATPTNLFLDGASARLVVPANTTWEFTVSIVARTATATGTYAKFVRSGVISRNVAVGTTAIATVDTIGTDRGSNANTPPAGWAVAITADTTNGALDIQVTGAAATNIRWTAKIELTEVGYP